MTGGISSEAEGAQSQDPQAEASHKSQALLRAVSQMTAIHPTVLISRKTKMGQKVQTLPSLICFVSEGVLSPSGPQTAHQDE